MTASFKVHFPVSEPVSVRPVKHLAPCHFEFVVWQWLKRLFTSTGEFWPSTISLPFVAHHESGHASDLFAAENRQPSFPQYLEEPRVWDASLFMMSSHSSPLRFVQKHKGQIRKHLSSVSLGQREEPLSLLWRSKENCVQERRGFHLFIFFRK